MSEFYDADGNLLEGDDAPVSREEIKTLEDEEKEKIKQEALAEKEEELKKVQEELEKEKDKEKNFKALRDKVEKTDEEKTALEKAKEEIMKGQQDFQQSITDSWKSEALNVFGITDKEEKEKIEYNFNRLKGEAKSKDEILKVMREAVLLTREQVPQVNPLSQAVPYSGYSAKPEKKEKGYAESEEGQKLGKELGLGFSKPKKTNK